MLRLGFITLAEHAYSWSRWQTLFVVEIKYVQASLDLEHVIFVTICTEYDTRVLLLPTLTSMSAFDTIYETRRLR